MNVENGKNGNLVRVAADYGREVERNAGNYELANELQKIGEIRPKHIKEEQEHATSASPIGTRKAHVSTAFMPLVIHHTVEDIWQNKGCSASTDQHSDNPLALSLDQNAKCQFQLQNLCDVPVLEVEDTPGIDSFHEGGIKDQQPKKRRGRPRNNVKTQSSADNETKVLQNLMALEVRDRDSFTQNIGGIEGV
ncbi:hypothetical protein SESBI_32036 [Sesbania bispinosa]|nr:hypothetical protein SESBI_32036 [Sesbania bispinosa]